MSLKILVPWILRIVRLLDCSWRVFFKGLEPFQSFWIGLLMSWMILDSTHGYASDVWFCPFLPTPPIFSCSAALKCQFHGVDIIPAPLPHSSSTIHPLHNSTSTLHLCWTWTNLWFVHVFQTPSKTNQTKKQKQTCFTNCSSLSGHHRGGRIRPWTLGFA